MKAYRRQGNEMVAMASWAPDLVTVQLAVDWKALGIDPKRARITAPKIRGLQGRREFGAGERIPVEPGKGWVLVISDGAR